ncbi:MAG: extracellular solute-binding protein, partial [Lachnospiraceae bacterium]|nr:extracellular solute-binding protein [Lachnospiraceae bacterium]
MGRSAKWLIMCLAGVMAASLMGCGSSAGTNKTDGQGAGVDGGSGTGDDDTAMGRYVESSQTLDISRVMDVVQLTDGRLELLEDGAEGRYVSSDGGATWEADTLPFWYNMLMEAFVLDMKGAPDGSVAVLSKSYSMPIGDWYSGDDGTDSGEDGEKIENVCELILFSPEGGEKRFSLPDPDGYTLEMLCFSEDGERLFLATRDEEIYEIDRETGEKRLLMQVDIRPDVFCVWEHYLAAKSEQDGVFLYDLDTREKIEDEVLSDFVTENYKHDDNMVTSTYTIFPAEDGGIYLAGMKGLHRHVIGGAVMEQVINGGLCGLSDPSKPLSVMKRSANDGFLAAYAEGKISSFTYDPDMPSTPSQTLVAYCLTESDVLRQAITRYQEDNPDVYVEYRVGLSEEGGVTREDAIKKLNTEIMAGKGPDLLVLDGLPTDSYKEKGVLLDISPYLAELETREPLLANIKESFTEDGKITMIPAAVTLPMYYTEQENMTGVSDLSALADLFEKLRKDHPGEQLMELHSKDMLFDAVFPVSAPNWVTASGEPDMERISGDLEQMKRIYDACMEGLPDRVLMRYKELEDMRTSNKVTAYNDLGGGAVQIAGDNVQVSMGALTNGYNYGLLQSVRLMAGKADNRLAQLPGSAVDAFTPVALMGINATSQKSDLAGDFMQMILSKEMQSMIYPIGFPVNEEGLSLYMESLGGQVPEADRKPGELYGAYGFGWDDGQVITVYLYVPKEQDTKEICDILKSVRTPYLRQAALEDAVRGAAAD